MKSKYESGSKYYECSFSNIGKEETQDEDRRTKEEGRKRDIGGRKVEAKKTRK